MRLLLMLLVTACIPCFVWAAEFVVSVESPGLGQVTQSVILVIKKSDQSLSLLKEMNCKVKGKKIPLSLDKSTSTWFVTTSDACGWGAASGPIWLVATPLKGGPSLLLSTSGNGLYVIGRSDSGFSNIEIVSDTAGVYTRYRYLFNGKVYLLQSRESKLKLEIPVERTR